MTGMTRGVLATALAFGVLGGGAGETVRLSDHLVAPALAQELVPASTSGAEAVVTFHVPTITCAVDPMRVEASLGMAPGIVGITFDRQNATITYDPAQVTPEQIAAAIEAGGDVVEPAEA
jgi:copper chaperone CopZ